MATVTNTPVDPFTNTVLGPSWTTEVPDDPEANLLAYEGDDVPEGSIEQVLAWVGHDVDRAKAVLLSEQSRGPKDQRDTLIRTLTEGISG